MRSIVEGALKILRVQNPRSPVDAISNTEGLTALNRMMHAWKAKGVDTFHTTLGSTDDFPLHESHEQGTIALLAARLAQDYGLQLHESIAKDAMDGWGSLQAEFMESAPKAVFDAGLTETTHLRGGWGWAQ